ncbi:MAG: argininosuccinate lyase [Burkholderiales bacterium]
MKTTITAIALALPLLPATAWAADTGQLPCKTTAECNEQAAKIGAFVPAPNAKGNTTSATDQAEDQFHWVNKINKASTIVLVEEKILAPEMGRRIATGVKHVLDQAAKPDGKRPSDVLQVERIITDAIGPDGSLIHAGRSRQDMYATYRNAKLRNQVLDYADALNSLRERVLVTASKNVATIIPAYTNGVQAQPISYAHYLLAYEASFERDAQRIRELYKRLNRSAMGTAVLANSSWPLDRKRLAELLGFDGVIENSLDSSQVSPSDMALEATGIASSTAIRLGAILGDIHTQYHQIRPWLLLDEGATYTSSAMPQKRNPGLIMRAREAASNVVGLSHTVAIRAHNVTTGMTDYKEPAAQLGVFPQAVRMIAATNAVMNALGINAKRALEELEDEWTTSMELAETLQKDHQVPFRVGHSFASAIVTHARANGLRPREFPYEKAAELFAEAIAKYKLDNPKFPVAEAEFRKVLSPTYMVATRVGLGGPQPAEVERMLAAAQSALKSDKAWMQKTRQALKDADANLDQTFAKLLD